LVCVPIVLSVSLLFTDGARATPTTRPVAWAACGGACAVPSGLSGVSAVAAGSQFSLALKNDGTVVAWGCAFNYGQCNVPSGLSGVTAIAAGHFHALAAKGDGTVVAWGCGGSFDYGQCTVPGGLSGVTAVSAGVYHSLALKDDGTVVAWGCGSGHDHGECSIPGGLTGVTAIAAGTVHSLALKSDGTVVAWGCGNGTDLGQCTVPLGLSGVVAIAAAHTQSLALKSDGTVVAWGCGDFDYGQCNVPAGLTGVTAIAAGYGHSLALKSDGTVVGWGCGTNFNFGQCTAPAGLAHVKAISAGDFHSLAVADWLDQTITFDPLPSRTWGYPGFFTLSAAASSGLPVSFGASGNCFIGGAGSTVFITSAGSCTVTASQPGGLNYIPAEDVARAFTIARAPQSITFAPVADKTYGDPDFTVYGSASSGSAVTFAARGNCTLIGATVHVTGAGSCTLTASEGGSVNYEPAPDVSRKFAIAKADQSIVFARLAPKTYGAADFRVQATASSGLPVSFTASGKCTVSGTRVHLTGAGSCELTAFQPGNANYDAAAPLSRRFAIAPAPCAVPKVVGKRLATAKRTIAKRHCRTGKVDYAYSRKRKKGLVVSQSRSAGRVLPANSRINLTVSGGRKR
jgi:PASTA domain/Regulator of chromosome condensation (RCC1) repeat